MQTWQVLLLGFIEGLTEFIPVSSTGHLLLAGHFMGFESPGKSFEVLIQLGAVLAILMVYFGKLWSLFLALPSSPETRRFVAGILLAFLPAAVVGVLAHGYIKEVLFETPEVVCISLIVGGVILLIVDRLAFAPRYTEVEAFPMSLAFKIGLCQCLAMIPGVSRSGSTIVAGLLLGADRRAAAEFSFFLAMPTMAGAFTYDLYKNWSKISLDDAGGITLGFLAAFVTAVFVVRYLLDFVGRYGLAPFAYWRMTVGGAGLVGLAFYG